MSDVAISGLTALGAAPATNDLLVTVDVDDTTQAPTGTTKKMTVANLFTSPHMTGPVVDSGGLTVTLGGLTVSAGTTTVQDLTTAQTLTIGQAAYNTGISLQNGNNSNSASIKNGSASLSATLQFGTGAGVALTLANSGAATFSSSVAVTSDFAVNTSKFTVAASTGNTVVSGTLGVTSDFAIATNKFTVAAASGNTVVAGTLGVTGALTAGSLSTGGSIISSAANAQIGTTVAFGGFGASYGWLNCQTTASVSSVATAISPNTSFAKGGMAMVYGSDGTNKFADLVFYGTTGTPTTVAAQTIAASPTARTYSMASNTLKLAMASGTYTIETTEMYKGT